MVVTHLHSATYGVLTDDKIYKLIVQDGKKQIESYQLAGVPSHIGDLHTIARQIEISHLWVMPGVLPNVTPDFVRSASPEWNTHGYYSEYEDNAHTTPKSDAHVIYARAWKDIPGSAGKMVLVGFPPYRAWGWEIETPQDLLGTLYYLSSALGVNIEWSPGHVNKLLIQTLNAGKDRSEWIRESSFNLKTLPFTRAAHDLIWKTDMLPAQTTGLYLHCYDKNSAYLAACTGVSVGAGDPVYKTSDIDIKLPGIYRVTCERKDSLFDGHQLPLVINAEWITTDVLDYARSYGYEVTVHEAYQFSEKHRTLESMATTLWKARAALHPTYGDHALYPNSVCRDNAYRTIKTIALIGIGMFASDKSSHLLRPDWWSMVVGRARATLLRKVNQLHQQGYLPALIYTDAVYFFSPDPNPQTAIPGLTDKWNKLGGYKCEYTIPVDSDMIEQFQTLKPNKLVGYLNDHAGYQE